MIMNFTKLNFYITDDYINKLSIIAVHYVKTINNLTIKYYT